MKTFSVILTVYAKENADWFKLALRSIYFDQFRKPDEIIIVADGLLNCELEEVIADFAMRLAQFPVTLKVIRIEENLGLGNALNEGLKHCRSEYVARMDSDDISLPSRFERQLSFLESNPDVDILGASSYEIDERGIKAGVRYVPSSHDEIVRLLWTCPLIHPTVIFRKHFIQSVGSYSRTLRRRQDYELWFRCAQNGAIFSNMDEPLLQYRVTDKSYSRKNVGQSWRQSLIGFKGSWALSLGLKSYIGVFYPFLKSLLPISAIKPLDRLMRRTDPREAR